MKRCPTCQRTYDDDAQKFCANDGTPLVNDEPPAFDPEATVMSIPRPLAEESSPQSTSTPSPSPPYYNPGAGSQPDAGIHQSTPPAQPTPPAWPPAQPQQPQPYYPQQGAPGGQPAWQGGQQQPAWMPPGQSPQGQNWGAGYPQQPGQYAPYGGAAAAAAGGKSTASLAALICGLVAFVTMAALIIIVGTRTRDLYDILPVLGWLSLGTSIGGLVLGIVGLIVSKTTSGKVRAGIGLFLSIIPLFLFIIGFSRRL